jgi:hypothetical protein
MLAAAEADFEPELGQLRREGGVGILGVVEAQAWQGFGEQKLLPRAKRLPPLAPVEAIRRGLNGRRGQD